MSPVSSVMSSGTTDQSREDLEPSVAAVDADRDGDEEHIGDHHRLLASQTCRVGR